MSNALPSKSNHLRASLLAFVTAITLSGCLAALVTGVAITTIDILHDRRTIGEYIDDNAIEITARNILVSKAVIRKSAHITPVSWNGIMLITGEIDDENLKPYLVQRFTDIQGVRQVVDESTITNKTPLLSRTNDAWITSKVKSRLILKTGLKANRVKVITTRGTVYLMGIVTREEGDLATEYSQTVRGVKRVVKVFEYQAPKQ